MVLPIIVEPYPFYAPMILTLSGFRTDLGKAVARDAALDPTDPE